MQGFHLPAVHADPHCIHCSAQSYFWSMSGQKCTWCPRLSLTSSVYIVVHVSLPLLQMRSMVRIHSWRGQKSSLYNHISIDSPQGTPWVHKEGIYTESIRTKSVRDTGGAGRRVTVQDMLTVVLLSSNRITPVKRWQQLQADGALQIQTFSPKLVAAAATAVLERQQASVPRSPESVSSFPNCLIPALLRRADTISYTLFVFQAQPTLS